MTTLSRGLNEKLTDNQMKSTSSHII
jgi:hypothetical protein